MVSLNIFPISANTFIGPAAITIDGTFTDWPAAPPPNPGCYIIKDISNTGIYDGTGFTNTAADINYFWNAISTPNGGTDNASPTNKIENIYYRIDTFTDKVIQPQQTYNIQLNLGAAAEGYADHLLQISVLNTASPQVRILLSQYDTPYSRMGAYTSGSITSRVCNVAGYGGVVDARAVGAYGKYDGTNYGIEVSIPVDWYGSAYGGTIKDDGTGARLFPGTLFSSTGALGSVGTVKDTINDARGDLDFTIVNTVTGETTYTFPPALTITKEGPDEATTGSYITFTGTLSNVGYMRAENVVLIDQLPAGLTFVSSSHSAVYDPIARTVTWNLGSLSGITAISGWITVQVDSSVPNGTHLINTFSITWKDEISKSYGPVSATKDVIIYTHPTLSVHKNGPATSYPGSPLTFTLDITNTGGLIAENITVVDTLPPQYIYVSSNPSGIYSSGKVTWNMSTLPAGGAMSLSLIVQVDPTVINNTSLVNSVAATWHDASGNSYGPVNSSLTTTIYTTPLLTITKNGPDEATSGSYITFTGTVTNVGGTAAENVVLVDSLPAGLTFISSSQSAVYDPVGRTVTWNLGTVNGGEHISGSLTVRIDDSVYNGSHLINTFSVSWNDGSGNSYGPATAIKEFTVYTHPSLSISKTGPAIGTTGEILTFTIDITNAGGLSAQNITIMDALPDKYIYVSSNPSGTYNGGNVIWNMGTLSAGGNVSVSLTVRVDSAVGNNTPLINGAMVTWQDSAGNSFGPIGSSLTTTIYTTPQITVTKNGPDEATAGSYITFSGSITNVGGTTAENVVLVDYLPAGLTFVSSANSAVYDPVARTVTSNIGSIGSGIVMSGWFTVQVDGAVPNGTHLVNVYSATWQDGNGNLLGPAYASKEVIIYTHPSLSISKTGPATGTAGGTLTFTIDITNTGGLSAQNVTLMDALSDNYTYISSNPAGTYSGGNVIWNLGTLSAGGATSVSLTVRVGSAVGNNTPLINGAMATWQDSVGNSFGPVGSSLTTTIYTTPQLTITKSGPAEATVGSYITFTGTLTNIGGTTAENTILVDQLPAGLTFVSSSHSAVYNAALRTVTWNLGQVASGGTMPGWITVRVESSVVDGTKLINVFSTTWQDGSGNLLGPAQATADVTCYTHPIITLEKTGPLYSNPGSSLAFTLTATNTGGLPAQNVNITDSLPIKLNYVSSTPPGTFSAGNVIWNAGSIAPHTSRTFTLTVQVDNLTADSTPLTNSSTATWQDAQGNISGPSTAAATTTIYSTPHLTISKSGRASATPGDNCTYSIALTNTSDAQAVNVTLSDFIPSYMNYVSCSDGGIYNAGTRTITWNIGALAGSSSRTITLVLQVDPALTQSVTLINTAKVVWKDMPGTAYGPASASYETAVTPAPVLLIAVAGPVSGTQTTQLTYTITVTNTSSSAAASNVAAQFMIPSGSNYSSSTGGGTFINGTAGDNTGDSGDCAGQSGWFKYHTYGRCQLAIPGRNSVWTEFRYCFHIH